MYCQNCGKVVEINLAYCRFCGAESNNSLNKSNCLKRLGIFSIGSFAAFLICVLTVFIFSTFHIDIAIALLFMMILFGITLGALFLSLSENYQKKKVFGLKSDATLPTNQIEIWKTTKELPESQFEPIPSVTDHTTELIYLDSLKPRTSGELG